MMLTRFILDFKLQKYASHQYHILQSLNETYHTCICLESSYYHKLPSCISFISFDTASSDCIVTLIHCLYHHKDWDEALSVSLSARRNLKSLMLIVTGRDTGTRSPGHSEMTGSRRLLNLAAGQPGDRESAVSAESQTCCSGKAQYVHFCPLLISSFLLHIDLLFHIASQF